MIELRTAGRVTSSDLDVYINAELHGDDACNEPEFLQYTSFSTGSFVSFNDDAGVETTFSMDDIDQLIEALEEIKFHHNLHGGGKDV